MYRNTDFEPGDVVFTSGAYSSLNITIVTKITPKMVGTIAGIKGAHQLCYAPPSVRSHHRFKFELNHFKKKYPDIDIKFKVIDK